MKSEQSSENKLDGWVTFLVIITTIIGALIAWRAAVSADSASGGDFKGIRALTKAESVRTTHTVDSYEDYRLFLNYKANAELGDYLELEDVDSLARDLEESRQLAEIDMSFLDDTKASRYLDRTGSYALERQLGEKWAAASREHNLDYEPRFSDGDRFRAKKARLLKAGILLTFSLLFFTLYRVFEGSKAKAMVAMGTLLLSLGTIWALVIERTA